MLTNQDTIMIQIRITDYLHLFGVLETVGRTKHKWHRIAGVLAEIREQV